MLYLTFTRCSHLAIAVGFVFGLLILGNWILIAGKGTEWQTFPPTDTVNETSVSLSDVPSGSSGASIQGGTSTRSPTPTPGNNGTSGNVTAGDLSSSVTIASISNTPSQAPTPVPSPSTSISSSEATPT